jgi:hypothetical protein
MFTGKADTVLPVNFYVAFPFSIRFQLYPSLFLSIRHQVYVDYFYIFIVKARCWNSGISETLLNICQPHKQKRPRLSELN